MISNWEQTIQTVIAKASKYMTFNNNVKQFFDYALLKINVLKEVYEYFEEKAFENNLITVNNKYKQEIEKENKKKIKEWLHINQAFSIKLEKAVQIGRASCRERV